MSFPKCYDPYKTSQEMRDQFVEKKGITIHRPGTASPWPEPHLWGSQPCCSDPMSASLPERKTP